MYAAVGACSLLPQKFIDLGFLDNVSLKKKKGSGLLFWF